MNKINFKDSNYYKNLEKYPMVKKVIETFIEDNYYDVQIEISEDTEKEYVSFTKERYYDNSDFENLESFYFKIEEIVMNTKYIAEKSKQDLQNLIYDEVYNMLVEYDESYYYDETISLERVALNLDLEEDQEFKNQLFNFLLDEGWEKEYLENKNIRDLIDSLRENQETSIVYDRGVERILSETFQATLVTRTYDEANSDLAHIGNLLQSDFEELFDIETSQERRNEIFEDLKENYQDELNNGFVKFLNSQGLNLEILKDFDRFKDFSNQNPSFVKKVISEMDNAYADGMNVMTYLVKIPFSEAIMINTAHNLIDKLGGILPKEKRAESWLNDLYVKIPKNVMCGLYEPVNGSGSVLEIYSIKEMEIPAKNVVVLVRTDYPKESNFGWYEADQVYGLSSSAYEHGEKEIETIEKSPQLNLTIEKEIAQKQENKTQLKI